LRRAFHEGEEKRITILHSSWLERKMPQEGEGREKRKGGKVNPLPCNRGKVPPFRTKKEKR